MINIFHPLHEKGKTVFYSDVNAIQVNELGHMMLFDVMNNYIYIFMNFQWYKWKHDMQGEFVMDRYAPFLYHITTEWFQKIDYQTTAVIWEKQGSFTILNQIDHDHLLVGWHPFPNEEMQELQMLHQETGVLLESFAFNHSSVIMIRGWVWYHDDDGIFSCSSHSFGHHKPIAFEDEMSWGGKFVSKRETLLFSLTRNNLSCYELDTGKKRWTIAPTFWWIILVTTDAFDRYAFVDVKDRVNVLDAITGDHVHTISVVHHAINGILIHNGINGILSRDGSRWIGIGTKCLVVHELFPRQKNAMRALFFQKSAVLQTHLTFRLFVW